MRLSNTSKKLINTISDKVKPIHHTKRTDKLFLELYDQITKGNKNPVKFTITERKVRTDITKPSQDKFRYIPQTIARHIQQFTKHEIHFEFKIGERNIRLIFAIEDEKYNITVYKKYAKAVAIWLHIINESDTNCSQNLTVYFYFSLLTKKLPTEIDDIIAEEHANTGFTSNCSKEIIIYRKEEWFKVFIHESFHNFNLDFSAHDNNLAKQRILSLFKVDSDVRLYEAYTETWAEIINVAFCSFFHSSSEREFLENTEILMGYERYYSLLQMNKVLGHIGTTYSQLFVPGNGYREKTNILSYFVIKCILMNEHQQFMNWCKMKNANMFIWSADINEFCDFIQSGSNKRNLFIKGESMDSMLRMSICELG
jgi:hypothetical protein